MANEISFTEWKKGDILTAERLNNIQEAVQRAGKALGIFNDDNNTSNSIQFSGASANVGSVSMDAHGLTVGNSNGIYTTTLYGTLQTDTISGITDNNVNIGNLIVGKYENNAYDGTAIFNVDAVEFRNNIEVDNDIILTGKINASSSNVQSIFSKAKINHLEVNDIVSNGTIRVEFKTDTTEFYGTTNIRNLTAPAATTTSAGLMSATDKMIIEQAVTGITLNNSEIPKRVGGLVPLDNYILPSFSGLSDGIYILQMTLADGNPTYEWVLKSEGE